MCGIVGYIGNKKEIDHVLLSALARLEYRGYDSAGLAALHEGTVKVLKESGKLQELKRLVAKVPLEGSLGIGHTRWATHGEPSQRNSHPHTDCTKKIAVVHNGIIENHEALRHRLTAMGHHFESETDTEVLPHLVEEYHLKQGHDLEAAVRLLLTQVEGSYAFCVISGEDSNRFVAARNGSPLVVGLGENENFVASDAPAILEHTRKVIFLEDHQMVVVARNHVKVHSAEKENIPYQISVLDWKADEVQKGAYEHFMLKEIEEQPGVVDRLVRARLRGPIESSLFDSLRFPQQELDRIQRILIQACGTSWHAGLTGKFLFEGMAGIPTEVDVSSEFRYRKLIPQPDTLVLSITQSGETIDTLMGIRHAKEKGFKALSICNVLGSTIARESDGVVYSQAGPEIGVASTKAYTAQMAILYLLALYWAKMRRSLTETELKHCKGELRAIPAKMQKIIDRKDRIAEVASRYAQARDFLFLGRGVHYPSAHEGALKIKEIAYIHATGHPAGEMKHGPIALIDDKMPVVAIAPRSATYEKMASNIQEVRARAGKVIAIATEGDESLRAFVSDILEIPETDEFLSPLLVALPLQYLAYYVAKLRGTDVDQPRNLAKSVTVE